MRMSILALLCFLAGPAFSSESETRDLIGRLSSDSYEERQEAYLDLCRYPAEYAEIFLRMSMNSSDLEVRTRLFSASKRVFLDRVLPQDERYQRIFGLLGAKYVEYYYPDDDDDDCYRKGYQDCYENNLDGMRIVYTFPDSPADKVLKEWDVIVGVNGKSAREFFSDADPTNVFGYFLPEREYVLKIRRYKDLDGIKKREMISVRDEYEEMEVRVMTIREDGFRVDREKLFELMKKSWTAFLLSHGSRGP